MSGGHGGRVRLERIVIGVDFGAPSVAAVGWVRQHFAPGAECLLVHAVDVPQAPGFLRGAFPSREEILKSALTGASTRLAELRKAQGWDDMAVEVRDGRPENVVAAAAKEWDADLVIVGEHARPRGMWGTLGSTAEALVRCSPVPVLLARNTAERPPGRILVAVDESGHATAALRWGRLLAQRLGASLTAVHVFRSVYLGAARSVSGLKASLTLEPDQLRQSEAWLDRRLSDAGYGPDEAERRIELGEPASALVAAQRGGEFDLAVIGSRGAGGVGRMLLGSVANGLLRGASCPVLVVTDRGTS